MNPPALYAPSLAPAKRKLPALEFRRVASPATRIDFCHVMSMAFEGGFDELREAYDSDEFWREGFEGSHGFEGYVGYAAGRAVTTACTVCDDRAVGLYGVSTSPHEQRKGYGEAMVRHAIAQAAAARGLERSVLQSSLAGLPLYRTLGYRTVGGFSIHISV
jgi:GNAT superfamily N-acetyltransferase